MAINKLTTRIVLRNDTTQGWSSVAASEDYKLLKGEVGIEFTESGKVKMKIGDGTSTWAQLPYFGGDECKVTEIEVAKGANHLNAISTQLTGTTPSKGDIVIVKEAIIATANLTTGMTQQYQYTAYVYGETASGDAWKAMDGNYSAENVYFDEDLTYTANIGVLNLGSKKSDKLSAAGKSLEQVMKSILAKTVGSTPTNPTFSLSATGTYNDLEVGSYITKVTWDGTYTDGKYSQGTVTSEAGANYTTAQAAGCSASYSVSNSIDSQTATSVDGTFTFSGDGVQIDSTSAKDYISVTSTCSWGAATKLPANNLGEYDSGCTKISSNSSEKTAKVNLTGYRNMFYKYYSVNETPELTNGDTIRSTYTKKKQVGNNIADSDTLSIDIPDNTKHIVICLHSSKVIKYARETNSNLMQDLIGDFKSEGTVTIKGANGFTGATYNIFKLTAAGILGKNTYKIKIGNA